MQENVDKRIQYFVVLRNSAANFNVGLNKTQKNTY